MTLKLLVMNGKQVSMYKYLLMVQCDSIAFSLRAFCDSTHR